MKTEMELKRIAVGISQELLVPSMDEHTKAAAMKVLDILLCILDCPNSFEPTAISVSDRYAYLSEVQINKAIASISSAFRETHMKNTIESIDRVHKKMVEERPDDAVKISVMFEHLKQSIIRKWEAMG